LGDHDGDGNIIWDDDDENLGFWPSVFEFGTPLKELYLISWDKRRRTIFRWNIKQDENAPPSLSCEPDNWVFDACIWTIEFLRLTWEDWWMDHINNSKDWDWTEYDWVIDTWRIDTQFASWDSKKRAELDGAEWFRQALFPSTINITDFNIFVYPNKDYRNAWKEAESVTNLSPYIMLNYKMKPSWLARKQTKIEWKEVTINSTINLTDIFSK
jgi:hypothetical protein